MGTLTLNADKEIWGQAPGSRSEVFYCRQTDENGDRAAIFDLFAAREKQIIQGALITSFTADKQIRGHLRHLFLTSSNADKQFGGR